MQIILWQTVFGKVAATSHFVCKLLSGKLLQQLCDKLTDNNITTQEKQ